MLESNMSRRTGRRLVRLILVSMAIQLLLVGYVFYQSYQGRTDLAKSQQKGCERGKKSAGGSYDLSDAVLGAFKETDKVQPGPNTKKRDDAETKVTKARLGFDQRAHIKCSDVYPLPRVFP